MAPIVMALFDDLRDADNAIRELTALGLSGSDFRLIAHDLAGDYARELASNGYGQVSKPVLWLSSLVGLLVGSGAVVLPGWGPVNVGSPLEAVIGGLIGAALGVIAGALLSGAGSINPASRQKQLYLEGIRRGGTLLLVRAGGRPLEELHAIFDRHFAVDIRERAAAWRQQGWTGYDARARPYTLSQARDERRRYAPPAAYARHEPLFRAHCGQTSPGAEAYTRLRAAYVYGWRLRHDARYREWDWPQLERFARRGWEARYPKTAWPKVEAAVRYAWQTTEPAAPSLPGDSQ